MSDTTFTVNGTDLVAIEEYPETWVYHHRYVVRDLVVGYELFTAVTDNGDTYADAVRVATEHIAKVLTTQLA